MSRQPESDEPEKEDVYRDGALPIFMLTFAFMHHPCLVRTIFGMPSLHLFTFFFVLFVYFFSVNPKICGMIT